MAAPKVLVVDDERHIVRLVQVNLERAGYEVVTAFGGEEALVKANSEKPDMVALDTMKPQMAEVLERLKANDQTKDIRVVPFSH